MTVEACHSQKLSEKRFSVYHSWYTDICTLWWGDVKYIWNNSYIWTCGCRSKWRMIIAVYFHFTPHGRYELNKLTSLPMCGFIAQLVEHRTGIAEVRGSNPVEALIFFRLLLSNCLNWKIDCDDQSSLSSITAVQIWIISYKLHIP